jgi:hypothetical protein
VGIFVTKKLLIGRYFLAAKANWDLADLPIGGSLLVTSLVRSLVCSLVRSFVGSLVRWFVRLSVSAFVVLAFVEAVASRDLAQQL